MSDRMYDEAKRRILGNDTEDAELREQIASLRRAMQADRDALTEIKRLLEQRDEIIRLKDELLGAKDRRIALLEQDRVLDKRFARLGDLRKRPKFGAGR